VISAIIVSLALLGQADRERFVGEVIDPVNERPRPYAQVLQAARDKWYADHGLSRASLKSEGAETYIVTSDVTGVAPADPKAKPIADAVPTAIITTANTIAETRLRVIDPSDGPPRYYTFRGPSRFTFHQVVRSNQRIIATADVTIVCVDPTGWRAVPIPSALVKQLTSEIRRKTVIRIDRPDPSYTAKWPVYVSGQLVPVAVLDWAFMDALEQTIAIWADDSTLGLPRRIQDRLRRFASDYYRVRTRAYVESLNDPISVRWYFWGLRSRDREVIGICEKVIRAYSHCQDCIQFEETGLSGAWCSWCGFQGRMWPLRLDW